MNTFLFSLFASMLASAIVLIIDRQRLPVLFITTDNTANDAPTYGERGKWKFIRAKVMNTKMPLLLSWLPRQTAENCRAMVSFFNEANELLFSMSGRWANTPELAFLPPNEQIIKVLYPDPVNIIAGKEEILDVVVMKEGETEAYGWNNEAYLNNWKTPKYKLPKGNYKVKIDINTQNGVSFVRTATLEVGENIETTFFRS